MFKAITFSFSIKYIEALAKEVVVEACPVLMIYQIRAALFIKRQMPHNACKGHWEFRYNAKFIWQPAQIHILVQLCLAGASVH